MKDFRLERDANGFPAWVAEGFCTSELPEKNGELVNSGGLIRAI